MTREVAERLSERLYWAIPFNRDKQDLKRLFTQEVATFLLEVQQEWGLGR